ncbi:MAG: hypothetical protein ACRC0L_10290, partial [Angustibacter sp.]
DYSFDRTPPLATTNPGKFYDELRLHPNRQSLPAELGKGYFLAGRGAYLVRPCYTAQGELQAMLEYSFDPEEAQLKRAMPLLRALDDRLKQRSDCEEFLIN